ncbi:MAG: alginate export family protein [Leptospirales bacterium]|nr:alginate export family protein [Leptospirales bacterium]
MKKLLVVLMALLFTTGAFAQDSGAKFNYDLWGLAFGAVGSVGSDEKWDYQHIRLRPMFVAENGNIKGVVRLQIDQTYGSVNSALTNGPDPSSGAGISARNIATKVQFAYLQVSNLLIPGLAFTTGLNEYYYPLIADIEGALTGVTYNFGMGTASFYYLKIIENDEATKSRDSNPQIIPKSKDEAQAYILDVNIKAGNIDVRPALFYATAGEEVGFGTMARPTDRRNVNVAIGAVNASGDMGAFDFDVTAAYLSQKIKDVDRAGAYGVDLGVNVKPDKNMKFGVFGTYTSGKKDVTKASFAESTNILFDGWLPAGRLFLLQQAGMQDFGGYYPPELQDLGYKVAATGFAALGLSAEFTLDKLTIFGQYGYAQHAKSNAAGDKYIGSEIDVKISYEVAPKTDLFLEYAYILAGDIFHNGDDDAQQILWGLVTRI